jgi:hypothetical protein
LLGESIPIISLFAIQPELLHPRKVSLREELSIFEVVVGYIIHPVHTSSYCREAQGAFLITPTEVMLSSSLSYMYQATVVQCVACEHGIVAK